MFSVGDLTLSILLLSSNQINADLVLKENVSWSDVEMKNVPAVYEAQPGHDLPDEHPALVLRQLVVRVRQSLEQVAAW